MSYSSLSSSRFRNSRSAVSITCISVGGLGSCWYPRTAAFHSACRRFAARLRSSCACESFAFVSGVTALPNMLTNVLPTTDFSNPTSST